MLFLTLLIMSTTQILRNALLGTGVLFGIFLALDYSLDSRVWEGMVISKSALTVEYCEFNHPERLFHQPMNTYSNLIYFFYGLLVFQLGWKDWKAFPFFPDLDRPAHGHECHLRPYPQFNLHRDGSGSREKRALQTIPDYFAVRDAFAHSWIPSPRLTNFKCCFIAGFVFGIAPTRYWQLPSIPDPTKSSSSYPELCAIGRCYPSSHPGCSQNQL
jgi:hypothetical protein